DIPDPVDPPVVEVCLTVANQVEDNGALVFDLFLRTSDDNLGGDLFLADSKFVLDYDASVFNNPGLFNVEDPTLVNIQYGYVTLLPTIVTGTVFDDLFRESVFLGTTPSVNVGQNSLVIDFDAFDPINTTELELNVARIDDQTDTHRLGRFRMTGFQSPAFDPNLSWNIVGPSGDSTEVFSFNPEDFNPRKAALCLEVIPYEPIDTMPEITMVEACAVIANQVLSEDKTELFFDIFLNTTPDNPGGDLYLADSDFIISFNETVFDQPEFSKVEDPDLTTIQYGYVTLLPTVVTGTIIDDVFRASVYNSQSTAVSFTGEDLIVSYSGPTPTDIITLQNNIPRIDGDEFTHRFGRFKVTGLTDPTADFELEWNTTGILTTDIYSYNPDDFNAYQIDLCTAVEPFVDTSETDPQGSLEFEFITFEGWNVDLTYNQLEFTVRNEFDIFFYNVTRSDDGVDFSTIGNIQAQGVGADTALYEFQDLDPLRGVNYYRIEAVTFSGEVIFSWIIEIRLDNGVVVEIYPTPVVDDLTLNYFSESDQELTVDLIDVLGRIVLTGTYELGIGENEIEIDTRRLAAATYFIRMTEGNSTEFITEKIIVINP
ncbi:MAG: T9SS type A sorting domain-containing protein, partial [Bacteroidota bacterium]